MSVLTGAQVFRKYQVDGVPGSGSNNPKKADTAAWATWLESMIGAGSPGLAYATLAGLNADLAHGAASTALVYSDSTPANNGIYVKAGASGSGSWSRIGDMPNAFVRVTVTGGTGNAIVATMPETPTVPGNKLYILTPTANNTTSTTIAINGGAAVSIVSALNASLAANALMNGVPVIMLGLLITISS